MNEAILRGATVNEEGSDLRDLLITPTGTGQAMSVSKAVTFGQEPFADRKLALHVEGRKGTFVFFSLGCVLDSDEMHGTMAGETWS